MASNKLPRYVYQIPYRTILEISAAMDASGNWRRLAGEISYSMEQVNLIEMRSRSGHGPTADLISDWGHTNATIDQFFKILHGLRLYREMTCIKPYVSKQLHYLLDQRQDSAGIPLEPSFTQDLPSPGGGFNDMHAYGSSGAIGNSLQSNRDYTEMSDQLNKPKSPQTPMTYLNENNVPLRHSLAPNLNEFPYSKIKTATSSFSDHVQLGEGGFSKVYKGWMDGSNFAIKVITPRNPAAITEKSLMEHHKNEIHKLTKYRHQNIINLCGYSSDGPKLCLIMEFLANGSLEQCLDSKLNTGKPLSWFIRHSILKDAACGLEFLHSQREVCIHGDIKSANILLDNNYVAKLADFGLAKQATTTQNLTGNATGYTKVTKHDINGNEKAFGTLAYLPSDFMSNGAEFSRFTDVFSMGVVICEILMGRKAYSKKEEQEKRFLKDRVKVLLKERCRGGKGQGQDLVDLADRNAEGWPGNLWSNLMDLALHCLQDRSSNRPNSRVLHEKLTDLYKEAQKLNAINKDSKVKDLSENAEGSYTYNEENAAQNKLSDANVSCLEKVMNIVEDPDYHKKLKAVGTSSLIANRGSEYVENDIETAVLGDMYGPGEATKSTNLNSTKDLKKAQDWDAEDARWLNYDHTKSQDEDERKEINLNAEADDPKYLQYDEKKLTNNETALLEKVPTNYIGQETYNELRKSPNLRNPQDPNLFVAPQMSHGPTEISGASMTSETSQPKSLQDFLSNLPESVKMALYYEMSPKMQQQKQQEAAQNYGENVQTLDDANVPNNAGNSDEFGNFGAQKSPIINGACSSLPCNIPATEKIANIDLQEDLSLPNLTYYTSVKRPGDTSCTSITTSSSTGTMSATYSGGAIGCDVYAGDAESTLGSKADEQSEIETEEFAKKVGKICLMDECDTGELDTGDLPNIGSNFQFL